MHFPLMSSKHSFSHRKAGAISLMLVVLVLAVGIFISPYTAPRAYAASVSGSSIASLATSQVGKVCGDFYGCPDSGEWCADFARWVWAQVEIDTASLNGAASSFYDYGQANGTLSSSPQVGDAVVFGYNSGTNYAQHVALVTSVNATNHTIVSVGGNEGGGNGVVKQDGPYDWTLGYSPYMGMYISGYVAPVGLTQPTSSNSPDHSGNVATWGPRHLDVIGVSTSGDSVLHRSWTGSNWTSSWENLGGTFILPVKAISWGSNRLNVFGIGSNKALYHRDWTTSGWSSSWEDLGGAFSSDITLTSWAPGRLDIFAVGTNDAMYHEAWTGSAWTGWEDLGGSFATMTPAAVSWGSDRLDVFGVGSNDALLHRYWSGSGWSSSWENLGGAFVSSPAVVSWGPDRLDIVAIGTNNGMYHKAWNGSNWTSSWENLGGAFISNPAVTSWAPGRLDIVGVGTNASMYHEAWTGSVWTGWENLGGTFAEANPAIVSWGPNHLDVFGLGTNNGMYHRSWTGSGWTSSWEGLGGSFAY